MLIKKRFNDYSTVDIDLINDGKVLSIYQGGSDLNLSCRYEDYSDVSKITFDISKEQEELYSIFDKLYTDIIDGNILGEDMSVKTVQISSELEKCTSWYDSIVQDAVITIMCDAYPIDCPNILRIKKEQYKIILEFDKCIGKFSIKAPYCISINIRQSGSRIYEFCIPFNTMFKQLQNIVLYEDQDEDSIGKRPLVLK